MKRTRCTRAATSCRVSRTTAAPSLMGALILKLLADEAPTVYGTGHKRRDFVHVDDVIRMSLMCMTEPRSDGRTLNVGSGENLSVMDVYGAVARLLRSDVRPVFEADLPGEARDTLADLSAARALGFEPKIGLNDGLARTIDYFERNVMYRGRL